LKLILGTLGLSFSDLEWERLFYTIDVDHNGKVSKLELVEWKLGQNYQQQNSLSVEQLAHEIFNSIDRHQTGEIKLSDFADAIYEFNHPPYNAKISDAEIIAIVKDMDENGDGVISFEEFKAIVDEYTRHSHAS
jgi:Ca2+-binding EF-hand superfamily protein